MSNDLVLHSESGSLIHPAVHDGQLNGIQVVRPGLIKLSIATAGGELHRLVLSEVTFFEANGFREGNIILDVTIRTGADVTAEMLEALYGMKPGESRPFMDGLTKRIRAGELVLFQLSPSYGCIIQSLCSSVSISPD